MKPISQQPLPDHAKKVFSGIIFDVYHWEQEQYDGTTKTFEKLKRPDTVLVVPVLEDGSIMLLDEEQPGSLRALRLAGGRVEDNEDPAEAVKRELLEETGYEASEWRLIDAVQPHHKIEWSIFTYVARGCKKVADQHLDSGEKVVVKAVSFDEFIEILANDDYPDKSGALPRMALRATYDMQQKEELRKLIIGI
jgi:ADP-ribose pyrophosphatase